MLNPTGQIMRATRENVWQAAAALHDQAIHPSVNRVRAWLGGGSNSSISQYLRQWHETQAEQQAKPSSPPEILQTGLAALYQQMEVERDEAIAAAKQAFEEQNQALEAQVQGLQETVTQLQERFETSEKCKAELEQQLAERETALAASQANEKEQSAKLAANKQALADSHQQLASQAKQIDHLFHQQMQFQNQVNEQRQVEASRWEEQLWKMQAQIKQLQDEKMEESTRRLALTSDNQQLRSKNAQLEEELASQPKLAEMLGSELARIADRLTESLQVQASELEAYQSHADHVAEQHQTQLNQAFAGFEQVLQQIQQGMGQLMIIGERAWKNQDN